jgi:hypothetical protein
MVLLSIHHSSTSRSPPERGIKASNDVAKPSEPNKPQESAHQKENDGRDDATLHQLAEARDKETANGG